MNMKKILNLIKIILIFILFLFLSSIKVFEFESYDLLDDTLYYNLYNNKYYNPTFYVRYDINNILINYNKKNVIDFYYNFTKNRKVAEIIFDMCIKYNIPLNIGFALAYEESRFNPKAINNNNNNGTIDKGLYQLNSNYHNFSDDLIFNPEFNANRGLKFLSDMISLNNGNITKALYCYNAGYTRINIQQIIPPSTYKYVVNILIYEDMLNIAFNKNFNY